MNPYKKIGILGGTFNPIHIGHLAMAEAAISACTLDGVIFIPSFIPPHKSGENLIDAQKRLQMVKLAIKDNPKFCVSDIEIKRRGRSYSIDTVKQLRLIHGGRTKFYFIIGQDSAQTLSTWKNIDALTKLVTFVVINRPGIKIKHSRYKFISVSMPGLDISSSFIRNSIAHGKSAKYFLKESVRRYIEKKRLYE